MKKITALTKATKLIRCFLNKATMLLIPSDVHSNISEILHLGDIISIETLITLP